MPINFTTRSEKGSELTIAEFDAILAIIETHTAAAGLAAELDLLNAAQKLTFANNMRILPWPEPAIACLFESDETCVAGVSKVWYTVPPKHNGWILTQVGLDCHVKGVTGTMNLQLVRRRAGSESNMLTTVVTLGDEYYVADGVINTSNNDVATGDRIGFNLTQIHSGTPATGCNVIMGFAPA